MHEAKRQKEKEKAVFLALQSGRALIRRDLEVHGVKADGSTELLSRSGSYESLWSDALAALRSKTNDSPSAALRPRVGLGVMVLKNGKVLMGKRKSSHGAGEWAWPGGHLEYMESFETCAHRETREEAGVEIENVRFLFLKNLKEYAPKHYVHIQLVADWKSGEPSVREPDKCEDWRWFEMSGLPTPRFASCDMSVESYKNGRNYFDA